MLAALEGKKLSCRGAVQVDLTGAALTHPLHPPRAEGTCSCSVGFSAPLAPGCSGGGGCIGGYGEQMLASPAHGFAYLQVVYVLSMSGVARDKYLPLASQLIHPVMCQD